MIAVVDTGGANLRSVTNALTRLGAACELTSDPARIMDAPKVLLPGVGAAADAMARLEGAGLIPVLRGLTQPVLGICLGMQLLFERSEEGDVACLGLIPGTVRRMAPANGARVPHVGWNSLALAAPDALFAGERPDACYYFVHSYQVPEGPWVTARAEHGGWFPAAVAWRNVRGVQFHPEKSQDPGARLLEAFIKV